MQGTPPSTCDEVCVGTCLQFYVLLELATVDIIRRDIGWREYVGDATVVLDYFIFYYSKSLQKGEYTSGNCYSPFVSACCMVPFFSLKHPPQIVVGMDGLPSQGNAGVENLGALG